MCEQETKPELTKEELHWIWYAVMDLRSHADNIGLADYSIMALDKLQDKLDNMVRIKSRP